MEYLVYQLDALHKREDDLSLLDEQERETYARRGESYLVERALLKRELSRRSGVPAGEIRFRYNAQGKPLWEPCPFNLSHSGNCLILAFHHSDIGVDVERVRPRRRIEGIALQIMCAEQFAAFAERGCPQEEFFACWCAAEALVKQSGRSIWQAERFPFLYQQGKILPLFKAAPRVRLFHPLDGYCAAVAYQDEALPHNPS